MNEQDRFLLVAILIILTVNSVILVVYSLASLEDRKYREYYSECFSLPSDAMVDLSVNNYVCDKYANYMIEYGSDHFVCYYGENSECGKAKICPSHVTEKKCKELGGVWFRENVVMDMMERFNEVFS